MSISKNLIAAREVLERQPERLRKMQTANPLCPREVYADALAIHVYKLLAARPNLTQSKLIAEAIYAAYQLGRMTGYDGGDNAITLPSADRMLTSTEVAHEMVLCSSDGTPISATPDADEIAWDKEHGLSR